jgi:hypothetical protein
VGTHRTGRDAVVDEGGPDVGDLRHGPVRLGVDQTDRGERVDGSLALAADEAVIVELDA